MPKHAGLRLVVFNMGLSLQTRMYGRVKLSDSNSKVINEIKKFLTNHVKKQGGFAWRNQLSSGVYQIVTAHRKCVAVSSYNLTTPTVKKIQLIKSEDLNVKGMMANHKLGLAISYLGCYKFRRQLEYKCKMYGASLALVAKWFPSSLTSSLCGNKQDMPPWYQDL